MRTKRITHITSFSLSGEMYQQIKTVSYQLRINSSDLIRMAIAFFLKNRSLNSEMNKQENESSNNKEEEDNGLLRED